MNTGKTADVEDLQEVVSDEESSLTCAAATAAADVEDPIQHFMSSTPQDRAEEDDASVHEEGVGSNRRSFYCGSDDDERSRGRLEGIIRQLHSDEAMSFMTQSTSDRDFAERTLPTDTFSFLVYTDVFSSYFLLGIMVFLFQLAIYGVLLYDIIDSGKKINKKNLFGFPFNVGDPVRIAEVIAIFISIITQQDVRKAICLYRDGFDESGLTQVFKGATIYKWWLSIVFRACEGGLGLIVTFLLIMRSDSVLDLLLNFSAIEFITMLDDVLFELASEGFLGRPLKKETRRLSRKSYYVSHACANSYCAKVLSIAYFVVLCVCFFGGWLIIYIKQSRGHYLCQLLFSQFGDDKLTMLGTFTGLFSMHSKMFDDRASYRGADLQDEERGPLLAYCEKEKHWTLSLTKNGTNANEWNPCKDWLAASSESQSFDLLATTSSPWIVNTPTNREAPLTHHFLSCHECMHVENFCGEHGKCLPGGILFLNDLKEILKYPESAQYDKCSCDDGHYGLRCEYFEPCPALEVSQSDGDEGFPKEGGGHFASEYYRLEDAETNHRPVYTSLSNDNESLSDGFDVILFTGERWIMSYKDLFEDLKNITDKEMLAPPDFSNSSYLPADLESIADKKALASYFTSKFHGSFTNYSSVYESEPVYISELLDADVEASPLSIRWRSSSEGDFVKSKLYCTRCNNQTNRCLKGSCLSNGICKCLTGYSGSRCEKPPKSLSNGKCEFEFNKEEYGFDGGDCCEDKCRSTRENICGKKDEGYIDIGYPFCKRESNQWFASGDAVYGLSTVSRSGYVVALGGRGAILAVADPGASIVRLFDKDGAEWKQRGQYIQGPLDSYFGSVMSLSSNESNNITHNPRTSPKVILAVGAPKIGLVRVFTCSAYGCIQRGDDMIGSGRFGNSLSVDGDVIAIGGAARETISQRTTTKGEVKVLTWANNTWVERGTVNFTSSTVRKLSDSPDHFRLDGYYTSLSGDNLAVGTLEGKVSPGPSPRFESARLITQVFRYNKSNDVWWQLGKRIERDFFDDASFGTPWPLKSVVMKGSVLAIGYNSAADVYSWDKVSKEWTQRKVELAKDPEGSVGWSVDLSEDANILAIGSSVENPQPTDKSIRLYQWDGKSYKVLSNGIPAGPASSLSLSSDGKAIAVGLPFDSLNGGSTRVYNFYSASPCDDPSEKSLRISFTTDGKPEETTWELRVDSDLKRSSGSLSGHTYTTFVQEMCVPIESCVRFLVCGAQGDWLESPGVFALMLDDKEVLRGSDFDSYDVTNCEGATLSPIVCPSVTQPPTLLPSASPTFSLLPTLLPSASPTFSLLPTLLPTLFPTISPTD